MCSSDLVSLPNISDTQPDNDASSVGIVREKVLTLKLAYRLAYGRAADPQQLHQLLFHDMLPLTRTRTPTGSVI